MKCKAPDVAVVGGGVVGLWCARIAAQQGASVVLVEGNEIGSGASGGILGALMPHQPTGWNAKKQFQLDGLTSLPGIVERLEAETGLSCGYRQVGRLMPIRHAEKRRHSEQWADGAEKNWPSTQTWSVVDRNPAVGWLSDACLPSGANHDTLSARIQPRLYVSALRQSASRLPNVTISEHCAVRSVANDGQLSLADGTVIKPGKTILAAGLGTFSLLDPGNPSRYGRGVKGQGALLKPAHEINPAEPILYDNGTYVIVHDNGLVAVGSTSENEFEMGDSTDGQLDSLIDKATGLCPALDGAETVERWAGVRPRAAGREPLVGVLPGHTDTVVATGGFKITFAIAHLMAEAAVDQAMDRPAANLPDQFLPVHRFSA